MTGEAAAPPVVPASAPAKVDPESLVLRGNPARVTRFRRGAIILIAGVGATSIAVIGWMALEPVSLRVAVAGDEREVTAAKAPAELFAGAPTSYGDAPKLGPALPGDLGRPILRRARGDGYSAGDPPADAAAAAAARAEADRERRVAETRAARESAIMLSLMATSIGSQPPREARLGSDNGDDVKVPEALPGSAPPSRAPARAAANADDVGPARLTPLASPWTLQAGSIIAASLITGLNSDLPGLVTAQVTENAYDSVTGRTLLIPQGSRLIGSYDNVVAYGQSRAMVVWQRIILPDGSSIRIDNMPATDTQGYAGLSDRIDRHTWQLLKGVALSTLLGVGTELGWGGGERDLVRAIRETVQQNGARAGDQLVGRSLDIQPTLKVRPAWPLRIVVHKDLVLQPWIAPESRNG